MKSGSPPVLELPPLLPLPLPLSLPLPLPVEASVDADPSRLVDSDPTLPVDTVSVGSVVLMPLVGDVGDVAVWLSAVEPFDAELVLPAPPVSPAPTVPSSLHPTTNTHDTIHASCKRSMRREYQMWLDPQLVLPDA